MKLTISIISAFKYHETDILLSALSDDMVSTPLKTSLDNKTS